MCTQQFGTPRTLTPIPRDKSAPFRLPRRSHRWRLRSRKCLFSSRCNQPPTSRVVISCSTPIGVEASWLWCLQRKSSSDFPKHPSAFLHPEYSLEVVLPHKTRSNRELCLPIVPRLENRSVLNQVLWHLLLLHTSSIHARAGTGASCMTKTRSCFSIGSELVMPQSILFFLFFTKVRFSFRAKVGCRGSQPSHSDTM